MANIAYNTTTSSNLATIWRKLQGPLADGIQFLAPELSWMQDAKDAKVAPSTREVLIPINLSLGGGVASISEGAYEGIPGTPAANEISLSLIQLNKRFSISTLVQIIDEYAGADATQIEPQLKYAARHVFYSMANDIADRWWGFSTAVLATTDTDIPINATGVTATLATGYGVSWITDPAFMARKFQAGSSDGVGDRVAFLNGSTRVVGAVGRVDARSTTNGTITVFFDASATVGISTNGLNIVKANSVDNTADDYNKGMVGMLDVLTSTSVNGLSSSTNANWSVAYSDSTGGTFNGTRLKHMTDEITNYGPIEADRIAFADGVYRNVMGQYATQLRFTDAFTMPIDGDVKAKGREILRTKRVPPGLVVTWASPSYQRFFGKPTIEGQTKGVSYGELKKMEDKAGYLGSTNLVVQNVCKARKSFAYSYGLTES